MRKFIVLLFLGICISINIYASVNVVFITAIYQTSQHGENIDSPAIWVPENPENSILFLTAKSSDNVEMHNPVTNTFLGFLGESGTGPGQFDYPNGIAVAYDFNYNGSLIDIVIIVEERNHRVSVFSLPNLTFLGNYGANDLDSPYGIAVYHDGTDIFTYITETGSDQGVYIYKLSGTGGQFNSTLIKQFPIPGAELESITVDPDLERVLVCNETGGNVNVYSLWGDTLITTFGDGYFAGDVEGIVIYYCSPDSGYVIISDQLSPTEFEIFSRKSYHHIGTFMGTDPYETRATDGVALTQRALPNLPNGAFFCHSRDKYAHCYDWADIANAFGLSIVVVGNVSSIPVKLSHFNATVSQNKILLTWITEREIDNAGFELYRKCDNETDFKLIQDYKDIPKLKGMGNSNKPHVYQTSDLPPRNCKKIWYKLMDVDYSGAKRILKTIEVELENVSDIPQKINLLPVYPNPFNPGTTIRLEVPDTEKKVTKISLKIFNIGGELIKILYDGIISKEFLEVTWYGENQSGQMVAGGIYFAVCTSESYSQAQKMVLLR